MSYKILSLDGGGTWAILEVMALKVLFPGPGSGPGGAVTGFDILRNFDLAISNSGGSIVLAGLLLNMPLDEIERTFSDPALRRGIFTKIPLNTILSKFLPVPKYSTEAKRKGLEKAMGAGSQMRMDQLFTTPGWPTGPSGQPLKAVIVGFDYDEERASFFRTHTSAHGSAASAASLLEAVHASSDAPVVFFDKPAVCADKRRYWDGAMGGYNNPLMAGVVEAVSLGQAPTNITALTLGTATVRAPAKDANPRPPPQYARKDPKPGIIDDARKAASVITDDPPDAATLTAHVMTGNAATAMGRVVRMSPVIRPIISGPTWVRPPGLSEADFQALRDLGMDAVKTEEFELIRTLGAAWIAGTVPNQPIRFNSDLEPSPGDATFAAAATRWAAL